LYFFSRAGQCRHSAGGNRVANEAVLSTGYWHNQGSARSFFVPREPSPDAD